MLQQLKNTIYLYPIHCTFNIGSHFQYDTSIKKVIRHFFIIKITLLILMENPYFEKKILSYVLMLNSNPVYYLYLTK